VLPPPSSAAAVISAVGVRAACGPKHSASRGSALPHSALRCAALRCAALRCALQHCAVHCAALRCALRCTALRCAVRCAALALALRCTALRCTALRCTAGTPTRFAGGSGEAGVPGNWERSINLFRTSDTTVVQARAAAAGRCSRDYSGLQYAEYYSLLIRYSLGTVLRPSDSGLAAAAAHGVALPNDSGGS
jgi:hypothetical protein